MNKQIWFATLVESQLQTHNRIIGKVTYPVNSKDSNELIAFPSSPQN